MGIHLHATLHLLSSAERVKNKNEAKLSAIVLKKIKTHKRLETNVISNQARQDNVQIFVEFPPRQANKHINTIIKNGNESEEKIDM